MMKKILCHTDIKSNMLYEKGQVTYDTIKIFEQKSCHVQILVWLNLFVQSAKTMENISHPV